MRNCWNINLFARERERREKYERIYTRVSTASYNPLTALQFQDSLWKREKSIESEKKILRYEVGLDSLYEKFCLLPCCNTHDRGSLELSEVFNLGWASKRVEEKLMALKTRWKSEENIRCWNKRNEDIHVQHIHARVCVCVSGLR